MNESKHAINWFEIPVRDLARATKFYATVFGVELHLAESGPVKMAIFPGSANPDEYTVHGALVSGEGYVPSEQGSLLYLNGGQDLTAPLGRVEKAGGKVIQDKMQIGEHGFIALFRDSEGNRLAMHSPR
jgi:predicted enzyme related to lactoylglutathione lyase